MPETFAAADEIGALLEAMVSVDRGVSLVPAGISGEMGGDRRGAMEEELDWLVQHGRAFDRRAVAELPFDERMARLRDPAIREAILAEGPDRDVEPALDVLRRRSFENLFPIGEPLDYEPTPDASVAAIARRTDQDPWAVTYDLMLEHDGHEFLLFPLLNYGDGSYDGLHDMMSGPHDRAGPRGRRCALRAHLRRHHDHLHDQPLGPRPVPGSEAPARVRREAPHRGPRGATCNPGHRYEVETTGMALFER